jgi:hypothetical protein
MSSSVETQARAFADEVRGGLAQKNWILDLGHPLLNRIAESFVKAAGVSTPQADGLCCSLFLPKQLKSVGTTASDPVYLRRSAQCRRSRGNHTSWQSKVTKPSL